MLPLLVLILVGLLDLGRIFYAYITITNAAREGARYGATHPIDDSAIISATRAEASASGYTICASGCVTVLAHGIEPGDSLIVTVSVNYPLFSSFIFSGGTVNLRTSAEMVIIQGVGN